MLKEFNIRDGIDPSVIYRICAETPSQALKQAKGVYKLRAPVVEDIAYEREEAYQFMARAFVSSYRG